MSSARDSSDDFFSSFSSPTTQKAALRARKPPPPPPRGTSTTKPPAPAANPYASSSTAPKRPPPPPPKNTITQSPSDLKSTTTSAATRTTTGYKPRPMPTSTTMATTTTSAMSTAASSSSYYGNGSQSLSSGTAPTTAAPAAAAASSSYYGTPAPAAGANDWNYPPRQATEAPSPLVATTNGTPSLGPASLAPTSLGPAPAPTPTIMNPYMLDSNNQNNSTTTSGQETSTSGLEGTMDTGATSVYTSPYLSGPMDSQPSTFIPNAGSTSTATKSTYSAPPNFDDEPPLLEELGINLEHIAAKTRAVVLPFQRFGGNMDATVIQDADLAGPVALALLLGGELLLSAKIQFGAIYGFGMFGCLSMTLVLNLMSPQAVSIWTVTSILGYALLPVNVLAFLKIFLVNLGRLETIGRLLGIVTVLWSTVASTRLMEQGCNMRNQRYLIAYPIALLYSAFVMITIF